MLDRIQSLGLELIEVCSWTRTYSSSDSPGASTRTSTSGAASAM